MPESADSPTYLERAAMHEQLASATDDGPARKMHQAMAAEYRRKAAASGEIIARSSDDLRMAMGVMA